MHEMAPRDHNQPPSQIEFAQETAGTLGEWLKNHPVILSEDEARDGKLFYDRASLSLKDMEDERRGRVRPLQEQVKTIDDEYRSPRSILEKIRLELIGRLDAWRKKEEESRLRALAEIRKRAEEAEKAAREAEERENEAIDDARGGAESDVGGLTKEADEAFRQYERMERELARAEKATDVKIVGGFGRAITKATLEKKELVLVSPAAALATMGWSERLLEALKSDAREYRRRRGKWPEGVIERRL